MKVLMVMEGGSEMQDNDFFFLSKYDVKNEQPIAAHSAQTPKFYPDAQSHTMALIFQNKAFPMKKKDQIAASFFYCLYLFMLFFFVLLRPIFSPKIYS